MIILLCANFLSRLLILIRPLKYIDGLLIPDDAYLAMTIAKNIALGLGPLYSFDYTNGFQPMYVFLIVPAFWIFKSGLITSVHASLFLLAVIDTLSLFYLFKLIKSSTKSSFVPILMVVSWIFNPYIIENSLNGLETIISTFFIIVSLYFFKVKIADEAIDDRFYMRCFIFGIIIGLAILARIDNCFLALSGILVFTWQMLIRRMPFKEIISNSIIIILGICLVYLPWLIYSAHYTGDIYPISGKAVRYQSLTYVYHHPTFFNNYAPMIKSAIITIVENNWVYIIIIAAVLLAYPLARTKISLKEFLKELLKKNPSIIILLIFGTFLFSGYTLYIFGHWFFNRYLFPLILVFILVSSLLIDAYTSFFDRKIYRYLINSTLLIFIIVATVSQPKYYAFYFSKDSNSKGYMNLGIWAKHNFEDGTRVACAQSGALGYFADNLEVINIDGKVNKRCFESLVMKRNIEYIKENRIEYIIGQEINIKYIEHESENFQPNDLIPMGKIEGFTSWGNPWYLYHVNYN